MVAFKEKETGKFFVVDLIKKKDSRILLKTIVV
jgi:hypothetical protein